MKHASLFILLLLFIVGCTEDNHSLIPTSEQNQEKSPALHLVNDISPLNSGEYLKVVIEIPAGSNEKWEVNKKTGKLERDSIDGAPRTIQYLGYPANYGFIPQTILPKEIGGDGDPLDVIVLGDVLNKGEIASCTILGMLKLKDRGEQDDKLILAEAGSVFAQLESLDELAKNYPGMLEALEDWFVHYKGPGKMISEGFTTKAKAEIMIEISHRYYLDQSK